MDYIEKFTKSTIDYSEFANHIDKDVSFAGTIHRIREMTGFSFVIIRTARELVQCITSEELTKNYEKAELAEGMSVELFGTVVKDNSRDDRFEMHVKDYKILSRPFEQMPITINKKELKLPIDTKLNLRPISLRHPKERAAFIIVDKMLEGFRMFLSGKNFTEIQAPKIVAAGAEGGADMFAVDYFGEKAYLTQSPQMYKQMMVGVFERVYTVGSVFRAEKHNTNRHLNEFTGMDFEMGFIESFRDVMGMQTELLKFMFSHLEETCAEELETLGVTLPKFDKIPEIRFHDAKKLVEEKFKRPSRDVNDLEPDEERLIGKIFKEEYGSDLVFITHYPSAKRPFYAMDDPENPELTLSFDLLLGGTEITTGGQRIHDYEMQVAKMQARGMNPEDFESYLMMHKYGIPPHGGLGLGLERFAMKLLGMENVREVTLFPRDRDRLEP